MAYMSQENKKAIAPQVKAILKQYGVKGTLRVRHHSTLILTLKEGKLDLIGAANATNQRKAALRGEDAYEVKGNYDVNTYWIDDHYEGEIRDFFNALKDAMNGKGSDGEQNYDKSDVMTDYFNVGWYIDIKVGNWNKPYVLK